MTNKALLFPEFCNEVLNDYYLAQLSRNLSMLGRKEVLNGRAKFGIFGDGKEIAQIAMAKNFRNGDWRSGYYRDQTFMLATGMITPDAFFAMLYGNTNEYENPSTAGRNFNNHFGTRYMGPNGEWLPQTEIKNSSSDISPTAGQMPRLLGLAYASKLYRLMPDLASEGFSKKGNELAFGTIGDASTSEGHFWEILNAAGVMQVPMVLTVWDDGYGISVPTNLQTIKASISEALKGFEKKPDSNGIRIFKAPGWDYPQLCQLFAHVTEQCRADHVPALLHINELTQPLGHSTSGSHERYKSTERLEWELKHDPLLKMKLWILETKLANEQQLIEIEKNAEQDAFAARERAYKAFCDPIKMERAEFLNIINQRQCSCKPEKSAIINNITQTLANIENPIRKDLISAARKILRLVCSNCSSQGDLQHKLNAWLNRQYLANAHRYSSYLYNETESSALNIKAVAPIFDQNADVVNGREILRNNFEALFHKYPNMLAFGEDLGKIGGVNQTYEGLQNLFGELRVADSGIRETAIIGQGIGLAMRGFRPVAEIQYFDYLLFALQTLSDDLATLHWRTKGGQSAPLIISTRGHRLEGVWHSGSPLSMVINSIRGIYVCVPRNMLQAAGFYNTLMAANDPALVIEPLNAYRLKEKLPTNLGEYKIPLGEPEILIEGEHITLVTYGSCVRIAEEATEQLAAENINVELIDVQTLLPFDLNKTILQSVQKTQRIAFLDEDVPGGATAFMMQKVLEEQGAWKYLDMPPLTITARDHRPAYTTDGDYFSNPNAEDVFDAIYKLMANIN